MWAKIVAFFMSILALFGIHKAVPSIEKVMTIEPVSECRYFQGACTDGKYIYQAFSHQVNSTKEGNYIFKIDAKKFKVVEKIHIPSGGGHMNDITYNSNTKKLVSAQSGGTGSKAYMVNVLDPETCEILDTVNIGRNIYSIDYDPVGNVYYAGRYDTSVLVLDSNFKIINEFNVDFEDYTKQGICYRNGMIYFLLYGTKVEKPNMIRCYTNTGDFVSDYVISDIELEPEGIFFLGDKLYVSYADNGYETGTLYRINDFK